MAKNTSKISGVKSNPKKQSMYQKPSEVSKIAATTPKGKKIQTKKANSSKYKSDSIHVQNYLSYDPNSKSPKAGPEVGDVNRKGKVNIMGVQLPRPEGSKKPAKVRIRK